MRKNKNVKLILYMSLLSFCLPWICLGKGMPIVADSVKQDQFGYDLCDMPVNGEVKVIESFIPVNGIVFDVGANVGDWSKQVLNFYPKVNIFAFEPIPSLCDRLHRVLNQTHAKIFPLALARETGVRKFFYYQDETAQSSLFEVSELNYLQKTEVLVNTVSLDYFCKIHGIDKIDFLKIDTEGAELEVLSGARVLLKHKKIHGIQFEYGYKYAAAGATLKEIYELLTSCGYSIYRIAPDYLIRIDQWREPLGRRHTYSNYLALLN